MKRFTHYFKSITLKKPKRCIHCKINVVSKKEHDLCYDCWMAKKEIEGMYSPEDFFSRELSSNRGNIVYIMFYGKDKNKVGYTNDLNSRTIENIRLYPGNTLVYFREFIRETEARIFEKWLHSLSPREINNFVSRFHDKLRNVRSV